MKKEKNKNKKSVEINFTILAAILIILFCVSITPVTFQNDTYYTIKIGEYISNHGIDMMDHFSWHENLSYTYPHWLYDLITYLIYSIFSFKGIYIITCILSAILGLSIFTVNNKINKNKGISFVITMGTLYILEPYIAARAQLVTFILFIWTIYFIEKFLENKKKRYAIGLIAISIAIANLHVAVWPFFFVLFMPYIGEYIIAILSDTIIYNKIKIFDLKTEIKLLTKTNKNPEKKERLEKKLEEIQTKTSKIKIKREKEKQNPYKLEIIKNNNIKWLILIMVICAFTGLLTPIGNTPYTYLYKTMQGNTTQNISEHLPMTLANNTEIMCALIIILAILIFTKTKIKLSDLFMMSGLTYLMLMTRRQESMFVLIGSVVITRMIVNMTKQYNKELLTEIEKVTKNILVGIALSILIILVSYQNIKPKLKNTYIDEKTYPVAACDYILENIDITTAKFYNEYNYGSYMLFRGIPVFIDSRADLYAPEFSGNEDEDIFSDFINTSGISKFYGDTFKKYGITHIICNKRSKMNMIITKTKDPNYKELYSDDNFVIYERLNVQEGE